MPKLAGLVAVVALGVVPGCDLGGCLGSVGVNTFQELEPGEALGRLGREPFSVVEIGLPSQGSVLPGAVRVAQDQEIPRQLLETAAPILVVASDGRAARSVAARLVRAGARRVAVVVVDPRELAEAREWAAAGSAGG